MFPKSNTNPNQVAKPDLWREDVRRALGGPVSFVDELARDPPEADTDAAVVEPLDVEQESLPQVPVLDVLAGAQPPALLDPRARPVRGAVDDVRRTRGDDDAAEPFAGPGPVPERRDGRAQLGAVARVAVRLAIGPLVLELEGHAAALVVCVHRLEDEGGASARRGVAVTEAGAVGVDDGLGGVVAVDEVEDRRPELHAATGREELLGRQGRLLLTLAELCGEQGAGELHSLAKRVGCRRLENARGGLLRSLGVGRLDRKGIRGPRSADEEMLGLPVRRTVH